MQSYLPVNPGKFSTVMVAAVMAAACAGNSGTSPAPSTGKIAPDVIAAAQALIAGRGVAPPARSNTAGRLEVYVYVESVSDTTVATLHDHGLEDMVPSTAMGVVEGWIQPKNLGDLAQLPAVTRITLPRYARQY